MKILKNNLDLKSVIKSGQMFRFVEEDDNSFTCILSDRVINVKEESKYLLVESSKEENLRVFIKKYFDLERDYEKINKSLSLSDDYMKNVVKESFGYKVLIQEKFETFISYIISQNNNIKRITASVNKISEMYGERVVFKNKEYYLFPSFESLKNITKEELRECGVGFRDNYILENLEFLNNNKNFLSNLENLDTASCLEELIKLKGIGVKVASCILLFSYSRFDTFPIDTWVKQNMAKNYPHVKNDIKSISEFAKNKYHEYSGLALQYMFNYERNK